MNEDTNEQTFLAFFAIWLFFAVSFNEVHNETIRLLGLAVCVIALFGVLLVGMVRELRG